MSEPALAKRRRAFYKGHWAEALAAIYLMCKGYRLRARRFKTPMGEIDLIMQKKDLVVVVEVKARADVAQAVDAVTAEAKRRIGRAADVWLSRQKDAHMLSIRFDIVAVRPWRLPVQIEDAF